LAVYNVQGQMVRVLDEGILEAGEHVARWDGLDQNGSPVASGLYFYALETEDLTASKKMILLR
jgi:flagellar hook assembly protein FlgD